MSTAVTEGGRFDSQTEKCQLAMSHCSYIGHVVGEGLVRPEFFKVDTVKQFQVPTTTTAVRGRSLD